MLHLEYISIVHPHADQQLTPRPGPNTCSVEIIRPNADLKTFTHTHTHTHTFTHTHTQKVAVRTVL
jgi:hypothetical protein